MGSRELDAVLNAALGLLVAATGFAGMLLAAAHAAAALTGQPGPAVGLAEGALALLDHPTDPGRAWGTPVHAGVYGGLVAVEVGLVIAVGYGLWRAFRDTGPTRETNPRRLPGLPTGRAVQRHTGENALLERAPVLRPSLAGATHVDPEQVGYQLARSHGRSVWMSVEDSLVVVGPPRSGKGMNVVVPMILEAPGAVVSTSLFTENLALTIRQRAKRGPVAVFAPTLGDAVPSAMRWSPIRGCEHPDTAQLRATALAAGTSKGVENASFWQDKTIQALYPMLHAASISAATTAVFDRWCSGPALAAEAVAILRDHPDAVPGWADKLDEIVSADPRTRDNMWSGVAQATRSLSNPAVLKACSPGPGEQFDPTEFLASNGTLYIVGDDKGLDAPLVAALIEDLFAVMKRTANTSPGNRLDPPALLMLDEVANIATLPSLPTIMSAGGGRGITPVIVEQSRSQTRDRWGVDAERAIWGAATVKLVLGGLSDAQDLHDLSTLAGTRDERTPTVSYNPDGTRGSSTSWREVPILRPEQIATLPKGVAVMIHPGQAPTVVDLVPYTHRPDADQIAADRATITAQLRSAAPKAG